LSYTRRKSFLTLKKSGAEYKPRTNLQPSFLELLISVCGFKTKR